MTEPEKEVPERRIRNLVIPPMNEVGRIRLGSSVRRGAYVPPAKIHEFRLTAPPTPPARRNVRRLPPFWIGLLSALDPTGRFLARYFREERPRGKS